MVQANVSAVLSDSTNSAPTASAVSAQKTISSARMRGRVRRTGAATVVGAAVTGVLRARRAPVPAMERGHATTAAARCHRLSGPRRCP